ncbi:MMPL family transporter [Microbulbifer spongiae]|uniref:MMPL family transporter n=1 Tax=Microbulbifer spongiae TaxID=2944933 RepID=A0ABY9EEH5_9GAMM|nr:MMPL family transporter [Microbulbifer sp. MI-G]WKD49939.1 MMPL family transporter [Microbulbifer sp. MI-G]
MKFRILSWLLLVFSISILAALNYHDEWIQTDILLLANNDELPNNIEKVQSQINQKLQGGVLWVLVSSSEDTSTLAKDTKQLASKLTGSSILTSVEFRWASDKSFNNEWKFLYPFRYQLLNFNDRTILYKNPEKLIQQQLEVIYGPGGVAIDWSGDPFSIFRRYFSLSADTKIEIIGGIPIHKVGLKNYTIIYSVATPFDLGGNADTPLLLLQKKLKDWAKKNGNQLLVAGSPLHTEYAASKAQSEIRTIGAISIIAICALCIFIFRSLFPLLASIFSILLGILSGIAGVIIVLGQMHILAFVFGTIVSGLAIDYAFHFICNRLRPGCPRDNDIFQGLLLGLVSSCLAFFALSLTPFSLLKQIGIFVGFGLLGAWLTVFLLFPAVIKLNSRTITLFDNIPKINPKIYFGLIAILLILGSMIIPQIKLSSDIDLFYQSPEFLKLDEKKLNSLVKTRPESSYFLVSGNSEQQVLSREWALRDYLNKLKEQDIIKNFKGVTDRFPPKEVQLADWNLLKEFYKKDLVKEFYYKLGFKSEEINDKIKKMNQPFRIPSLMAWSEVTGELFQNLWLGCHEDRCYSVVRIYGLEGTIPELKEISGVVFIDPVSTISKIISSQNDQLIRLLPIILIIVLAVTIMRLGVKQAISVVILPLSSVIATISTIILMGTSVNLFHVAALLLIFGIGMDYAVFGHICQRKEQHYTQLSITMAGLTTLLGFGLLALSETPAIADFGLVLTIGLLLNLTLTFLYFCIRGER